MNDVEQKMVIIGMVLNVVLSYLVSSYDVPESGFAVVDDMVNMLASHSNMMVSSSLLVGILIFGSIKLSKSKGL